MKPLAVMRVVAVAVAFFVLTSVVQADFNFTILHTGDVRSNFLPVDAADNECPPSTYLRLPGSCFGGVSRRAAYISKVRSQSPNPVLLVDAGNVFQGTLFFYQYRGKLGMEFMKRMNYTAANIGIREFDAGIDDLAAAIDEAGFPVLSSNLNLTSEPRLSSRILPFTTMNISGETVGIIGYISSLLTTEGNPGPTIGLRNLLDSLRSTVEILQLEYNAQVIVALSANDELDDDIRVAQQVSGIDIILGSYGDTLLINNNTRNLPSAGRYPVVAQSPSNRPVLIASLAKFGKFIGHLNVNFDSRGILTSWSGDAILLSNSTVPVPDPTMELLLQTRYNETQVFRRRVVGSSAALLDGTREKCRFEQCAAGTLLAEVLREKGNTQIGLMNSGGIRASIPAGNVTFGDLISVVPFQNTLARFSIRGSDLAAILTNSVSRAENTSNSGTGRFMQVAGLRFSWNPTLPPAVRVIKIEVQNAQGQYEDIQPQATYTVATTNFIAVPQIYVACALQNGGDEYNTAGLPGKTLSVSLFGPGIDSILIEYFQEKSPISAITERRITTTDQIQGQVFQRSPVTISEGLKAAAIVITGVLCIFPIIVMGVFMKNKNHAVVVTSSRPFVQLTLLGCLMTLAGLAAYILGFNDVGCMIFPWFSGVGFTLMYGSLFAKSWRIWQVFKKVQSIRRRMITNKLLFGIVAGFLAIELIILIVWTAVPDGRLRFTSIPDPNPSVLLDYQVCSSQYALVFFGIFLAYKGVVLLMGIYLSFVTRNVDSDFRESKYIAFSIYSVFLTMLIVLIVLFIVGLNPLVRFILTCLGVWIVTASVYLLLYVPKLMAIVQEPDNMWRGYFARRAQEITDKFGKSRPVSGFGGSYVSSFGDSSSDMQEAVANMNRQQKKAYLDMVERNWEYLVTQKRNLEKFMDSLRSTLKMPQRDWVADAEKVETPRSDGDGSTFANKRGPPMTHDSVHSVIVREDGTIKDGGLRRAPKRQMETDMYDESASDTGEGSASSSSSSE